MKLTKLLHRFSNSSSYFLPYFYTSWSTLLTNWQMPQEEKKLRLLGSILWTLLSRILTSEVLAVLMPLNSNFNLPMTMKLLKFFKRLLTTESKNNNGICWVEILVYGEDTKIEWGVNAIIPLYSSWIVP